MISEDEALLNAGLVVVITKFQQKCCGLKFQIVICLFKSVLAKAETDIQDLVEENKTFAFPQISMIFEALNCTEDDFQ